MRRAINFNKWSSPWLEKVYSWKCIICADNTKGNSVICELCKPLLPYMENSCSVCGVEIAPEINKQLICGKCQQQPPYFDSLKAAFWYQHPVDKLIVNYKYNNQWQNAQALFDLTRNSFQESCQDKLIIPVPSHNARIRARGFNVVYEYLKLMRATIPFEYNDELIQRVINTTTQAGKTKEFRRKNIKNAFTVCSDLPEKKILIIDDVVTTSTTVNEISRCLKISGAKHVGVWTIARAR